MRLESGRTGVFNSASWSPRPPCGPHTSRSFAIAPAKAHLPSLSWAGLGTGPHFRKHCLSKTHI